MLIVGKDGIKGDSVVVMTIESPVNSVEFRRLPSSWVSSAADYTGRYYSDETEAFYTIREVGRKLTLEHRKFQTVNLTMIAPDQFTLPHWWMSHIRFLRDKSNKIISFEVNNGRILGLKYRKQ